MIIGKNILNLIVKSPFKLVKDHMEYISFSAKKILPLVKSIEKKNWHNASLYYVEINKLRENSNYTKKKIKFVLNGELFMSISKTDLLNLLKIQEKLFDKINYISNLLIYKKLKIPHFITEFNYYQFMQSAVDSCHQAFLIIVKLEKIINNGFPKKEIQILNNMIKKLYIIENVSNKLEIDIKKKFFSIDNTFYSKDVIYTYKIIDLTSNISYVSRQIGKKVTSIMLT